MSQDLATEAVTANATTLVLVLPTASPDATSGAGIAGALERAARALRSDAGIRSASFHAAFEGEGALMRRVEAEVYGAD